MHVVSLTNPIGGNYDRAGLISNTNETQCSVQHLMAGLVDLMHETKQNEDGIAGGNLVNQILGAAPLATAAAAGTGVVSTVAGSKLSTQGVRRSVVIGMYRSVINCADLRTPT